MLTNFLPQCDKAANREMGPGPDVIPWKTATEFPELLGPPASTLTVRAARLSKFPAKKDGKMAADYAHRFARVTISGTVFNGAEEWSTGFQFGNEDDGPDIVEPGIAQIICNRWETFFENPNHAISNAWVTTRVKVALINTDGTTDEDNIDYFFPSGTIAGGQGGTPYPPQLTLAATLTSEYQRGLASKGRMYLPGIISGIDGQSGKLGAAYTNTLNTGFKTFLDGVNADDTGLGYIILASKGHKTAALDANNQPVYVDGRNARVTGCRIGNVYDTQRRRRNELSETYDTKVLA